MSPKPSNRGYYVQEKASLKEMSLLHQIWHPCFCKWTTAALLLVVLSTCGNPSQPPDNDPTLFEALQDVLNESLAAHDGTGISAAVIVPGEELWSGTAGISHGDTLLEPEMVMGIASITKTCVAALVLQLAVEGVLSLEDSLHRWLPTGPHIDSTITIRQLLNHTSGIREYWSHPGIWDSLESDLARYWSPEEIITTFVGEPYFPPGSGWHYSGTDYILLGMIIEAAAGNTVSAELRRRFLDPLGLDHTSLDAEEGLFGTLAHNWDDLDGDGVLNDFSGYPRTAHNSLAWTAGGMYATAADVARWTAALFGGQVLQPASLEQMLDVHTPVSGDPAFIQGYGLGVIRFGSAVTEGHLAYGHDGYTLGFKSITLYYAESGLVTTVIVNDTNDACKLAAARGLFEAAATWQEAQ